MQISTERPQVIKHIIASASESMSVEFHGIADDMAGYAISALFDPYVLTAKKKHAAVFLSLGETPPPFPGLRASDICRAQKERIVFAGMHGERVLYNPNNYRRFGISKAWTRLASIAELPGAVVKPGTAVFAFDPLALIRSYLNMAEPAIIGDIVALTAETILRAKGDARSIRQNDMRRDFHAYGIAAMLIARLAGLRHTPFDMKSAVNAATSAARSYVAGKFGDAKKKLASAYMLLKQTRIAAAGLPLYIMHMPHGGILFRDEGYAEYDWPEGAMKVLALYLSWAKNFGYRFAPDISAGTLVNLNDTHPKTIKEFADAWKSGIIEFVNGTWGQPYMQLWRVWDQKKHITVGIEAFEKLFKRRPVVYAAQEMALHPNMPGILKDNGYRYAIHRAQNLGSAPDCNEPVIEWKGYDGRTITALPSHASKSEKHGSSIFRDWPELVSKTIDDGIPFAAITSFIDQTFVGAYQEEFIRANRFGKLFGEFMTPSAFFAAVKGTPMERYFTLDEHTYDLGLPANNYHRYEMGMSSTLHAYWNAEAARLEDAERQGELEHHELIRLLEGEAHDAYILPYFKQGAFIEMYLTEYIGPRYRVSSDGPRGVARYIKDTVRLPDIIEDRPRITPSAATIKETSISAEGRTVAIDAKTGAVISINDQGVRFGEIRYKGNVLSVSHIDAGEHTLSVHGEIPGAAKIIIDYFISGGTLYGIVALPDGIKRFRHDASYWEECIYLAHIAGEHASVIRHTSGVDEPTGLGEFFSVDRIAVKSLAGMRSFRHGGNIFFRHRGPELHNRLWSYEDRARSFWWGVAL